MLLLLAIYITEYNIIDYRVNNTNIVSIILLKIMKQNIDTIKL